MRFRRSCPTSRNRPLHILVYRRLRGALFEASSTIRRDSMKLVKIVTAAVIAAFALPALAQTQSTPRIDQRQQNQERRIEQGEKSGALTQKEAARLEKAQDRQSKKIYREKHDKQTAK